MAHVLVFQDEPHVAYMIAGMCESEGHLVTKASTVEDTLMILRTSLHPMIVIAERDHSSLHADGPFFVTNRDHPELYGQHRYIAVHWWPLSDDDIALLDSMNVARLTGGFSPSQFFALVNEAAASLG